MINWLSKTTFYAGAIITFLFVLVLLASQFIALDPEAIPVGKIELILIIIPKLLLITSAVFLLCRHRNGLLALYGAFFASIIHSVYVLGILESGKRYISDIQFITSPFVYWAFKSFFYIIPLILYCVWIIYWLNELKSNKVSQKDAL